MKYLFQYHLVILLHIQTKSNAKGSTTSYVLTIGPIELALGLQPAGHVHLASTIANEKTTYVFFIFDKH